MPAWSASIAHAPAASSVTVPPLTLHAVEAVENVTALPDPPPVALTVNGGSVAIVLRQRAEDDRLRRLVDRGRRGHLRRGAVLRVTRLIGGDDAAAGRGGGSVEPETAQGPDSTL